MICNWFDISKTVSKRLLKWARLAFEKEEEQWHEQSAEPERKKPQYDIKKTDTLFAPSEVQECIHRDH